MDIYPPGTVLNSRYEIIDRPLAGGMGVVYICFDKKEQRPVAIKEIRPDYLHGHEIRAKFINEANTWLSLGSHPNIVSCYSIDSSEAGKGDIRLVLELITRNELMPDASLRSILKMKQKLSLEKAIGFALQIVNGMKYAAQKIPGLIHRDIKPENILVGADNLGNHNINRVRITDFGLAISQFTQLEKKYIEGTPLYMAPEQWQLSNAISVKSDIYSFGCVFFEMLTGEFAIVGNDSSSIKRSHQQNFSSRLPTNLDASIAKIVSNCCQYNPDHRYSSWNELEDDLVSVGRSHGFEILQLQDVESNSGIALGWSYISLAEAYMNTVNYQTALNCFEKSVFIANTDNDKRLLVQGLLGSGRAAIRLGNIQSGFMFLEDALSVSKNIQDTNGIINCYLSMGHAFSLRNKPNEAIEYYELALNFSENEITKGIISGNLAIAYRLNGDYQKALNLAQKHYEVASQVNNLDEISTALANLGTIYRNLGDYENSRKSYTDRLQIVRELGDRTGECNTLIGIANVLRNENKHVEALTWLNQAIEISREIGHKHSEATALLNLAGSYLALNNYPAAIATFLDGHKISESIENDGMAAEALIGISDAYLRQERKKEAIQWFHRAETVTRKTGNNKRLAYVLVNIGLLSYEENRYDITIGSLSEYFDLNESVEDVMNIHDIDVKFDLANAYRKSGKPKPALELYEDLLYWAKNHQDSIREGKVLGNIGTAYADMGEIEKALPYFEQRIDFANRTGDENGKLIALTNLGSCLVAKNEFERAINVLEESLVLASKFSNKELETAAAANLGMIFAQRGELSRACEYYKISAENGDVSSRANLAITSAYHLYKENNLPAAIIGFSQAANQCQELRYQQGVKTANELQELAQKKLQAVFEDILTKETVEEIKSISNDYPFVISPEFIAVVENLAKESKSKGEVHGIDRIARLLNQVAHSVDQGHQ